MFWLCFFSLSWNSFIENFGTHIIVSVTIGGKDVIYVKQHQSSPLSKVEIKNYVQDIGNQRFSTRENHTTSGLLKYKDKASSAILLCFYRIFSLKISPAFALCLWLLTNPLSLSLVLVPLWILQGVDPSLYNSQGVHPQPSTATSLIGNGKEVWATFCFIFSIIFLLITLCS